MPNKDESKGTPGTNPNGTPKDESKGTPKDKGKLYTVAQIDKIKSDAAGMGAGREKKAAGQEKEALTQELQTTKTRLDALEREANESRLAEARAGGDDQLRVYQREEAVRKRERQVEEGQADMTRREGQVKTDREAVDADRGVVSIAYVAAKHGLETEELESLGISDQETLEKVAEKIAAAKPAEPGEGEGGEGEGEGEEGEAFVPDTVETTGGGAGALTTESVEKMPISSLEKAIEKSETKSK